MSVRVIVESDINPTIELDLYEITTAAQTGLLRVTESIKQKQEWWHGYKGTLEDKISKSISGAMAEQSLCKYLKIPYEFHTNVGSAPDVKYKDYKIQVRSQTPSSHWARASSQSILMLVWLI